MTQFRLNPNHLDKWMHQNKAKYTGIYFEGVLLDSFILQTKRGFAAVYEHYVNPNMSDYMIKFVPYRNKDEYDDLFCEWYDFREWYIKNV